MIEAKIVRQTLTVEINGRLGAPSLSLTISVMNSGLWDYKQEDIVDQGIDYR